MRLTVTAPHTFAWTSADHHDPGPGEVRVRTRLSAVSVASELGVVVGGPFPAALGYQSVGVVEAVGTGVTLHPGTRVVTTAGHTPVSIERASRVVPVPDAVPDTVAVAVILGEETHKGIRRVGPHPGEAVLVAGAGLLGLLAVFNLTRRGAVDVTVLEPDAARRARAATFGATAAFAPGELPHDAFDVGIDCSAAPAGFAELLAHLRPRGRAAVLSDGNWGALTLPPAFHARELSVVGSSDGEDYAAYARWLWAHAEPVLGTLFERTVRPGDLPDLYRELTGWPRPVSAAVDWTSP